MPVKRCGLTLTLVLFTSLLCACSLQIDKIFEMQPGSDLQLNSVLLNGERPTGVLKLEGGAVMRIIVTASVLDYLDGTVDGDVEFLELLFGSPGFFFFGIINTQTLCVALDQDNPGGGTFTYDVLNETAHFDVTVNSRGFASNPAVLPMLPEGFLFPFDFDSEIPLTLVDGLAFFTGGDLTISQFVDEFFEILPVGFTKPLPFHIFGTVTLTTTDTFPTTPRVLECLDFFANPPTI